MQNYTYGTECLGIAFTSQQLVGVARTCYTIVTPPPATSSSSTSPIFGCRTVNGGTVCTDPAPSSSGQANTCFATGPGHNIIECGDGGAYIRVPYVHQYHNSLTQNCDCGPAAIAMTFAYYFGRIPPAFGSTDAFLDQIRLSTGNAGQCTKTIHTADTGIPDLVNALRKLQAHYFEINDTDNRLSVIQAAIRFGQPVIVLVDGSPFGRNSHYGLHWVVVTGFLTYNNGSGYVIVNDPDDQPPQYTGWVRGGQDVLVDSDTFAQAIVTDNDINGQPTYGIVVTGMDIGE